MKILVTGSRGTLGAPLVRELRGRGHEVWGCDLQHSADANYVRCDISEYRQVERVLAEGFDVVYHLAAEFGRLNGEHYYEQLWRSNVIGTRHILEVQRRLGFRLVFASSSEVYGEGFDQPLAEGLTATHPLAHHNDYAVTKWVNEGQVRRFVEQHGNEAMTLRFFNAYGPGEWYHDYRSVVCLFCYRALHGLPYTVYKGYHRVFMYIGDFVPTLANACERFRAGDTFNIGGDEYRSVEELSRLILDTLGLDDSLVTYQPEDEHNVVNKRPDISRAVKWLDHENRVPLEEGVPATLRWMAEVYPDARYADRVLGHPLAA